MTCPCGDVVAKLCAECDRPLCAWHWAANLLEQPVCIPSCNSPRWDGIKSREAVLSEVAAQAVSGAGRNT